MVMMKNHFSRCNRPECLCEFVKFYYASDQNERLIEDQLIKNARTYDPCKVVIYDKVSALRSLKKDYLLHFDAALSFKNYAVDTFSQNFFLAVSSFYYQIWGQIKGSQFEFVCSFLSFMIGL